jgi:hypothetical protein
MAVAAPNETSSGATHLPRQVSNFKQKWPTGRMCISEMVDGQEINIGFPHHPKAEDTKFSHG